MPEPTRTATLTPTTDDGGTTLSASQQQERRIAVDFNPDTLQIELQNTIQPGRGRRPAQTVSETRATLKMQLVFDTTTSGQDVREKTHAVARLMDPVLGASGGGGGNGGSQQQRVPAIVLFEWGTVRFEGYIDQFREAVEFFSADGVPLRSVVRLSLTQQERTFSPNEDVNFDPSGVNEQLDLAATTQTTPLGDDQSVTDAATAAGDPGAARSLGEQNGVENLRQPGAGALAFGAGAGVRAAAAFGGGVSVGGAVGVSAGLGVGSGGAAGASISAELEVGGTAELFAGLHQPSASLRPRARLQARAELPAGASVGIGRGASFGVGGQAVRAGSDSLSADVGAAGATTTRLRLGEEK